MQRRRRRHQLGEFREYLQSRKHNMIFEVVEYAISLLPDSSFKFDEFSLEQEALRRCGPGNFWHIRMVMKPHERFYIR